MCVQLFARICDVLCIFLREDMHVRLFTVVGSVAVLQEGEFRGLTWVMSCS